MNYRCNDCDCVWYAMGVVSDHCLDCGSEDTRPLTAEEIAADDALLLADDAPDSEEL